MDNFEVALKKSSVNFKNYLEDIALQVLGGGEFEIVEGVTKDKMSRLLDTLAGIDLWHINTKHGIRGVANRVQYSTNYKTFTIRKSRESGARTEYEKRAFAIEHELLYPVLTLQGYLEKSGEVLGFAIAKTVDIINMIKDGNCTIRKTGSDQIGQASFYVVNWQQMKNLNYKIYIYES